MDQLTLAKMTASKQQQQQQVKINQIAANQHLLQIRETTTTITTF